MTDNSLPQSSDKTVQKQKKKKGQWEKGESGNLSGRPPGAKNKTTLAAQALLEGEAENLTRQCVQLAKEGHPIALKLVMERILTPLKERPIKVDLVAPDNLDRVIRAMNQVVEHVTDGKIGPQEGHTLMSMLATTQKTIETVQLEQRIAALESIFKSRNTQ